MKMNMMKLAFLGVLSSTGMNAQAALIDLNPTADGDAQTFGGDTVDTTDTKIDFSQSGSNIRNGVLEFDLSSLAGNIITGARLELTLTRFVSNAGSNPAQIDIFAYNGDGVVDISDYAASGTQVVNASTPQGGSAGDVRSFIFTDVTPLGDALTAGGLLTLRIETDSFASIRFASLENTNFSAANLNLEYSPVPVPAAVWLFGSGLIGLIGVARRTKK